jgi:hypothetical protein
MGDVHGGKRSSSLSLHRNRFWSEPMTWTRYTRMTVNGFCHWEDGIGELADD